MKRLMVCILWAVGLVLLLAPAPSADDPIEVLRQAEREARAKLTDAYREFEKADRALERPGVLQPPPLPGSPPSRDQQKFDKAESAAREAESKAQQAAEARRAAEARNINTPKAATEARERLEARAEMMKGQAELSDPFPPTVMMRTKEDMADAMVEEGLRKFDAAEARRDFQMALKRESELLDKEADRLEAEAKKSPASAESKTEARRAREAADRAAARLRAEFPRALFAPGRPKPTPETSPSGSEPRAEAPPLPLDALQTLETEPLSFATTGLAGATLLAGAPPGDQGGTSGDTIFPWPNVIPPEVKEVKDRADLKLLVCRRVLEDGTIKYLGFYYKEQPREYVMEFDYIAGVGWLIRKPGPQGPTYIIYDLRNGTRTVQEFEKEPTTTKWKEAPPPPVHKTTPGRVPIVRDLPVFPRSTPIHKTIPGTPPTVARPPIVPTQPTPKTTQTTAGSPTPVEPAPAPPAQETPPTTRIGVVINMKPVTIGEPPTVTWFVLSDPKKATDPDPDKFALSSGTKAFDPVAFPWEGDDPKGPNVMLNEPPPPGGEPPVTTFPPKGVLIPIWLGGGYVIYVGWGWTFATVPAEMVGACSNGDDASDLLKKAEALEKLAKAAEEGGPEYWRLKAERFRREAIRLAESRPRSVAGMNKMADEADATAKQLGDPGWKVPENPDHKDLLKPEHDNPEHIAAIKAERQRVIEAIKKAAKQLRDRAASQ